MIHVAIKAGLLQLAQSMLGPVNTTGLARSRGCLRALARPDTTGLSTLMLAIQVRLLSLTT
jgi:hypothetical protein